MRRIAAFVPNQLGCSPGQRARIELWTRYLEADGWAVDFYPFEDEALHEVLYSPGWKRNKASRMLSCYAHHLSRVVRGIDADIYYLYREASMVGPALAERVLARRSPPLIYDLDDPAWIPYNSPLNGWMSRLKCSGKTRSLVRMADHVITINEPIASYANRLNPAVTIIPNLIDTDRYRPTRSEGDGLVRIGWIGSHSTLGNLHTIAVPLALLQGRTEVRVRVIASGPVELPGVDLEIEMWSADTEIALLNECDIGVVPLTNHTWNRWKFFFKTIQYMALGLPVVAGNMGSNREVITDGVNGFLVDSEPEWLDRLELLAGDPERRWRMGRAARATVLERYSIEAHLPRLLQLFDNVGNGR